MGKIKFLAKIARFFLICLLTILIHIFIICFFLLILPFAIYRKIIFYLAPRIKPELGKMINLPAISFSISIGEAKGMFVVLEMDIEGGVDLEEFKKEFEEKIINLKNEGHLVYPEIRQVFTQWMGYLFWKNAPNFSIDDHVLWLNKSPSNSKANEEDVHPDLNQIRKEMLLKKFPPNKPIWDLHLVEYGGNTKLYFRWHHSYFDGISCMKLFSKIISEEPNIAPRTKILNEKNSNLVRLLCKFWKLVKTPYFYTEFLTESLMFYIFDWLWNVPREDGQFNMEGIRLGQSKYIPLEKLRETAGEHQVNVYSVVLAGISGGIRRFMLETGFKIRNNPVIGFTSARPNHPDDKLRNHVYGSFIKIPFDQPNREKRLKNIFGRSQALKNSYFGAWGHIAYQIFNLPISIFKISDKGMPVLNPVPFFYTGIPGPKVQLFWRGQKAQFTGFFLNNNLQPLLFTSVNDAKGLQIYVSGTKSILPTEDSLAQFIRCIDEEFDLLL